MQRIGTTNGLYAAGDPLTNTKGTIVTAACLNALQEEIAHVIESLGGELNPADNGQLIAWLRASFAKIIGSATQKFSAADGTSGKEVVNISQFANGSYYQRLPGGFIFQWGVMNNPATTGTPVTFPIAFLSVCYGVYAGDGGYTTGQTFGATSLTLAGFIIWNNTGLEGARWFAIGR